MTNPASAAGPVVLFIDDEENILRSLTRLFMDEPYAVATTSDPKRALEIMAAENIKVIVSDQRMPQVTGVELLTRSKAVRPDAVRILFTGYADIQATQDAINKGEVYRYVSKPWDDEGLKVLVRDAIRNFDLVAENRRLTEVTRLQNEELVLANDEIRKAYEKEKNFSSTVSHELRTPLSAIRMAVDLVGDRTAASADKQATAFLGIARKNVDRLTRLINDILGLSKLQSGADPLTRKPDDLNRIVQEAAEVQELAARGKGLQFVVKADPALPQAEVDADRLQQVLNNLLNNAVKFTERGSVTVETRSVPAEGQAAGQVEVAVRDTGRGMPSESLEKIFEKFCQLGSAQDRVGGTGLGLSICREIIQQHGGRLWAESELGKGSAFIFRLPVIAPTPPKGERS